MVDRWPRPRQYRALHQSFLPPECRGHHYARPSLDLVKEDIKPGEEIAYDYGKEYFEGIIKEIGCKCAKCCVNAASDARLQPLVETDRSSKA